ncbi:hypothetical protein GCM10023320_08680 [Pseudonocardia adelaidensis]|uniref:Uncharacterized protein n=1 Tax=Pseudonocardia adelaidensis TaxID=648754 RepID=A0ABP9NAL2_9PSEU
MAETERLPTGEARHAGYRSLLARIGAPAPTRPPGRLAHGGDGREAVLIAAHPLTPSMLLDAIAIQVNGPRT